MRVISGKYKGKNLDGFNINGTRPTMDRVKESLFAMIFNNLENSVCLDLFAGSGSLGLEALSNGAKECYFIDNNKEVIKVLEKNLKDVVGTKIIKMDYQKFLNNTTQKFDIIFLDPPYHENKLNNAIKIIMEKNLLNDNGILICEYEEGKVICDYKLVKSKKYGPKIIEIYLK